MTKFFWTLALAVLLFSCGQRTDNADSETIKEGNKSITFSTDTAKLSKLIDLKIYKPTHAKFQYIFIDNSGQNERVTVPGPSDNYLQAVLSFDTATYRQLKTKYLSVNYPSPNYNKHEFNFEWLDADVRTELLQSDTSYHGHSDFLLGLGLKGKLWFLDNKLLLTKATD